MFDFATVAKSLLDASGAAQRTGLSPWAVRPDAIASSLQTVRSIRARDSMSDATLAAAQASISRRGQMIRGGSYATRIGNVAIIPVIGPLVSRYNWSYWSYDEIVNDLRAVGDMPDIAAVLLDIDSPGGMVANVDSVPDEIARLRMKKPVFAHVGGLGASAAYWIAASAEKVTAEKTALVGSVGALIRYVDMEGILTRLGATVVETIASDSPNKRLSRDTPEGQAELQAIVDDGAGMFIDSLVSSRGVSRETILESYGQGLVFPAAEALQRGMIDGIGSFESIVAELVDRSSQTTLFVGSTAAKHSSQQEASVLTLEKLKAENPELVAALLDEAGKSAAATTAKAVSEAVEAERSRILGIEEHGAGLSGVSDLVKKLKADGKTTPAEAAAQILAAQKAQLAEMRNGLAKLDQAAAGVESTLSGGDNNSVPQTAEGWEAEWKSSAKLQAEFPTAAAYVATMKREKAA